jgi:hypothetical protein
MQVKALRKAFAVALAGLAVSAAMPAKAQDCPAKPISLVLPQPACSTSAR